MAPDSDETARMQKALAAFDGREAVEVRWHSYQLDPTITPDYEGTEADYLVSSKGMSRNQVDQTIAMVKQQAAGEGLEYDFDRLMVANSLKAHHLIHIAAVAGVADAVKEALLRAHFVEDRRHR